MSFLSSVHTSDVVDVCLVLEGTYPLHLGGISTWVDALVRGQEKLVFAVARIGKLGTRETWAFSPPKNLKRVAELNEFRGEFSFSAIQTWAEDSAKNLPKAKVYQAVGAGFAASLAKAGATLHHGRFLLSEHASYTEELALGVPFLESGSPVPRLIPKHRLVELFLNLAEGAYRETDIITALSQRSKKMQIALGARGDKIRVVPNGVLPSKRLPPVAHETTFHLAYVGRIAHIKGTDIYIKAIHELADIFPNMKFSLLGPFDCDLKFRRKCAKLRVGLEDRLTVLGPSAPQNWGIEPDCIVVPSRSEAQPLVILEAFSKGIPVIANDVGDCRELIYPDEDAPEKNRGIVLPQLSTASLTTAVIQLASSPTLRRKLAHNARQGATEQYSLQMMLNSFKNIYSELDCEAAS